MKTRSQKGKVLRLAEKLAEDPSETATEKTSALCDEGISKALEIIAAKLKSRGNQLNLQDVIQALRVLAEFKYVSEWNGRIAETILERGSVSRVGLEKMLPSGSIPKVVKSNAGKLMAALKESQEGEAAGVLEKFYDVEQKSNDIERGGAPDESKGG